MNHPISYRIAASDLAGHRYSVSLTIAQPDAAGQIISLPNWIPGSYLIRDFSRHIETISAYNAKGPLSLRKLSNNSWQIAPSSLPVTVEYQVYAFDLSVRGAHLDESHGFFNGTSVFLQVHGFEEQPCLLEIIRPKHTKSWRVHTSLPIATKHKKAAKPHGFGMYSTVNYDALIDHPVEMGQPAYLNFTAGGVLHEMVFTGVIPNLDLKQIAKDCAKICTTEIQMFEPETVTAPFADSSDRYVFMVMVTDNGHGGLEHRSSTALATARNALPVIGQSKQTEEYRNFLGLVSHEYFHSWNVKRIKPARFVSYALDHATPTYLLWIFEGFTSYYDDLVLRRSGVISEQDYLSLLAKTITRVMSTPGRLKQTVADSSFDAWNKYYKQDENADNAIVSYYTKGALIALCLDLYIRSQTKHKKSLDDVMRHLWQNYGKNFYQGQAKGLGEDDFVDNVQKAVGVNVADFLKRYVYGLDELPLAQLLKQNHFELKKKPLDKQALTLNVRTKTINTDCQLSYVQEGGVAHKAGLSAGDVLVAIDGLRVDNNNLQQLLKRYSAGQKVAIHVFRRDELRLFKAKLEYDQNATYELTTTGKVKLW